jgi:PDZ domain-containing protein
VGPGCPADGKILPGDVLVSVDGRKIHGREEANRALDAIPAASAARMTIRHEGKPVDLELRRRRCAGAERPLFGIAVTDNFPFDVDISGGGIGGPSAGLMLALGLYDRLTDGDLAGGHTVAGTGSLDLDGNVLPVGGVEDKVRAARAAGADVFLIPEDNLPEVGSVASGMRLLPVATFEDAVSALTGDTLAAARKD